MRLRWLLPAGAAVGVVAHVCAYAATYLTVEQAQQSAFPAATEFRAANAAPAAAPPGAPAGWAPRVIEARNGTQRLGWLLVDEVIGKSEQITYSVALDPAGKVLALEVLEYRESHGSEIKLPAWRKQFVGKGPADAAALGGDVKIISGATLSCRHVTEGVQRLLRYYAAALHDAA